MSARHPQPLLLSEVRRRPEWVSLRPGSSRTCFLPPSFSSNPLAVQKALTLSKNAYDGRNTTIPSGTRPAMDSTTAPSSVSWASARVGGRHLTIESSPRLSNLNSKSTFRGPRCTTCVSRLSLGITWGQDKVEKRSLGMVGNSWLRKSLIYLSAVYQRNTPRVPSCLRLE